MQLLAADRHGDALVAIFLSPARLDLETTRTLLRCFGGATGLRTNVDKCIAMPIRCQQLHIDEVTDVFPCQVMHFPCPYLGLPLSYKRPSRAALQPVLDKIINRCPTWKANLMAKQGRLILIKTVKVSIPVHHSIALELPDWFLKAYEQRLRAFFWQGSEKVHGGQCMVAWETGRVPASLLRRPRDPQLEDHGVGAASPLAVAAFLAGQQLGGPPILA